MTALKLAIIVVGVPIFGVLGFIYVSGFEARAWTANLSHAAFFLAVPVTAALQFMIHRARWIENLPASFGPPIREGAAYAIAFSLLVGTVMIEPDMTAAKATTTYFRSVALMLLMFGVGSLFSIGLTAVWARVRNGSV